MDKHMFLYHFWNYHAYQIRCSMSNSKKILETISKLIENGILTSNDIKKEISSDLKFKKDKLIKNLELVSRDEFEVLKKIVQKQEFIIKKLQKNKKTKKAKRS